MPVRIAGCPTESPSDRTLTRAIPKQRATFAKPLLKQEQLTGDADLLGCVTAAEWSGDEDVYGLVNNAGVAQAGILATCPNTETEKVNRVNLLGAIQMARAVSQRLLRNFDGGRIINISSIIGTRGYNGMAAYSASKAGMDGLTRALGRDGGISC
jgi:3-oxoacyl-[acyl-carrier protein] reductase